MFIHVIYFWLQSNTPGAARAQLVEDCRAYLGKVPGVRQLWPGRPAMTPREVVDNSNDVGVCVVIDDVSTHDQFMSRKKQHLAGMQVYDFQTET